MDETLNAEVVLSAFSHVTFDLFVILGLEGLK